MSTTVGRLSRLDQRTLRNIQAGCDYVNAEVHRRRMHILTAAVVMLFVAVLGYGFMARAGYHDIRPVIAVFAAGVLGAMAWASYHLKKSYKTVVVRRVVEALGSEMTYRPESAFTKSDFIGMRLFDRNPDRLEAEDEITGHRNAVTYTLLEAHATYQQGSGKNRHTVVLFHGLIIRLDFNKHFTGHTVVVSQAQSEILGGLFGESESRKGEQIVRLENPEFERLFSVYSTDQQQARYILTPKLMELIVRAQEQFGAQLKLAFHTNSVFVTLPQRGDRFEPRLFGAAMTPEDSAGDLLEVIGLVERLIDALELETRIWTRV